MNIQKIDKQESCDSTSAVSLKIASSEDCLNQVIFNPNVLWSLYPLRSESRDYLSDRGLEAGIIAPGHIVQQYSWDRDDSDPYYVATEEEICFIENSYRPFNIMSPPWHQIQSDMIRRGFNQVDWRSVTAPALVALLGFDPSRPDSTNSQFGENLQSCDQSEEVKSNEREDGPPLKLLIKVTPTDRKMLKILWNDQPITIDDLEVLLKLKNTRSDETINKSIYRMSKRLLKVTNGEMSVGICDEYVLLSKKIAKDK